MSGERLKELKERSKLRRQLLAQQLGVEEQNFGNILGKKEEAKTPTSAAKTSESSNENNELNSPGKKIAMYLNTNLSPSE